MLEARLEIKTQIIGPGGPGGGEEMKEGRVLNRVIRITSEGWEDEADQRHADLIIEEL